jgi:nitrate/TMAO reductase-like tetraheme cytochrome c subunit
MVDSANARLVAAESRISSDPSGYMRRRAFWQRADIRDVLAPFKKGVPVRGTERMRAGVRAAEAFIRSHARLLVVAGVALVAGIGLAAGYASAVQVTSTQNFCAHGCHEMERTVAAEYATSRHARNASGAVTACVQCHNPQGDWVAAMGNEIAASSRLWGHAVKREDLPGRFEARRPALAEKVWAGFKASNARECKACHQYNAMILAEQASLQARRDHATAAKSDANCLDCHKGVAHQRPDQPINYDFP